MSGLSALLAIDTGALDAKLAVTADAGGASASLSLADPLSLLGDAGDLIRNIQHIVASPDDIPGAVLQGLDVLGDIAPFAGIAELDEALAVFAALKERLEPLRDLVGLDPGALLNKALHDAGGLDGIVQGLVSTVADTISGEVPEALQAPMAALRDLSGGTPDSAASLASFVARFVLGLDLDRLRAPYELLDAIRDQAARGGGDLSVLEATTNRLIAEVDGASTALLGRAPDLTAIAGALAKVQADLDALLETVLPGAIHTLSGDIAAIDVEGRVGQLDGALGPLIARVPVPPRGVGDVFLPPLRALSDGIDTITADAFTGLLAAVEEEVRALFVGSDVANLRDDIRTLMGGVTGFIRQLPLPQLRLRLTQALLGVQQEIGRLADFSPVADLGAKLAEVTQAIDGIDLDAVREQVDALKAQMEEGVAAFPIDDIRAELEGLIGAASDAVADVPPLIDELRAAIDALCAEITSIDLSGPGDQGANLVKDLRENVKTALSNADLPAAVTTPIGVLAGEVRKIDLTASLDAPISALVAKVDVGQVLAPVQQAIDQARTALQTLSPTALVQRLDKPFDELVSAAEQVSPAALVGRLSGAFQDALGQLDRLDPVTLVAPLQDQFDQLVAQLRALADPAPLLAPLRAAYAELVGILDAIDPTKLFGALAGQISKLPATLGQSTTAMLDGAVGPGTGLALTPGGGAIKFGDIVRPFAALVAEARAVLHRGADTVIGEGLELVSAPLALLHQAGTVAGSHVAAIGQAMEARRGLVDPLAPGGPMPELRAALVRLSRIEAALAEGGRSSVQLHATIGAIQLDAHITASFPARQRLTDAMAGARTGLSAAPLGRSFQALGQVLSSFAPATLLLPATTASVHERLDALLDVIDPKAIADEMDAIGTQLQTKLQEFASDIAAGLFSIWNRVMTELAPILPHSLMGTLGEAVQAVRDQLAALDPASLEAELDGVLDAVVAALDAYSPAAFAGTLTGSFDAIKAKIGALDPAALLGDLNPLGAVLDEFKALRPSQVLAPLLTQAEAIDAALASLLDLDPVAIVDTAITNLKAQIELVLQKIEVEIDGLLLDLESAGGGGGGSISVSASLG